MIAFLLTGGLGTRLRPVTLTIPKPMIKVAGMPFLEAQIRLLSAVGIKEFVISTGYLFEQVESYFKDGQKWGVKIQFSREDKPLGTGGAMMLASKFIKEDFLLLNGDDLPIMDYAAFLATVKGKIYKNIMTVHKSKSGNISLDRVTGQVKDNSRGKVDGLKFVHSGLTFFNKEVLKKLPKDIFDHEDFLFGSLIKSGELNYFESRDRTLSIGSFDRLRRARQVLPKLLKEYQIK